MFTDRQRHGRRAVMAGTLAVALAAPMAGSAFAAPAGDGPDSEHLVINEAYLVGGSSGQAYDHRFIELYNPTDAAVDLSGWSLQYGSATGNKFTSKGALSGSVAPGGYFLVQASANGGSTPEGEPLPTPDAEISLTPSGSNGVIGLVEDAATVSIPKGALAPGTAVVDLLGYGSADTFEVAPAPAGQGTGTVGSLNRTGTADDNSLDFEFSTTVTPQNASGETDPTDPPTDPTDPPTDPTDPPTDAQELAIAEIQGTGDASPVAGQQVRTTGVVTAAYPTGGFDGFYLQTAGTGGDLPADHAASDGIFVYSAAGAAQVSVGDHVEVTGEATEFYGLTQIAATSWELLTTPAEAVKPATVAWPADDGGREALEGMLLAPEGDFTVTDTYSTNRYGSVGLASGTTPLVQPTAVGRPGSDEAAAQVADNAARALTLDDGASWDYLNSYADEPLPYLTGGDPVRVGAGVTFTEPVVLDYRFSTWGLQPTTQLTGDDAAPATFENTRTDAPEDVGGDLQVATFNVLNYFTTLGADLSGCSAYTDREGNPVTVRSGCDARGAWNAESLDRQQTKIVAAISALGADVVSLEEIENSAAFGKDRDAALEDLVAALNAVDGADTWSAVGSPAQTPANEDVIRTAFIYRTAAAEPVGDSQILLDDPAFSNAREPLAQTFRPAGATADQDVVVITNHFKSKGSGSGEDADQGDGQGASNASRVNQATALVGFADDVAAEAGTERVLLVGDFNSYDREDPLVVLQDAGYTNLGASTGEYTYAYGGQVGSLDHVFASDAAAEAVTGTDIWNINAYEPVANEYSRYNYNVSDLYDQTPFRSSDHDPIVVGLDLAGAGETQIDLLGINDYHGRIDGNTVAFAGTIEQERAKNPDGTVFVSAGDNIGASLFASAVANDQPTIDVMNALELRVSAVGNHEFDQGIDDLTGRVTDAANWPYLGANVYAKGTTTPVLDEYAVLDVDGVQVGFVGAVTEETPTLVTPAGIADLDFGDPVEAVNRVTDDLLDGDLTNGEADVVVAMLHEGASEGTPEGASLEDELAAGGPFAHIVNDTDPRIAAIYTGHTHKQYAWDAPIPGTDRTRPVVQTGSYGEFIGHVSLTVGQDGEILASSAQNVARTTTPAAELVEAYPRVAEVDEIVTAALAEAEIIGAQPVGSVTDDITTAFSGGEYTADGYQGGSRDDRASESTLGMTVANALLDTVANPDRGGADLGVVNPGGLRNELYVGDDGVITYAEANAVLPFVNNVYTVTLTGEQLDTLLEQQWQTTEEGDRPQRPYLALGLSDNVSYTTTTADPNAEPGENVSTITIDGAPIDPAAEYTVATFSFLVSGGDNFRVFRDGTDVRDTGLIDRDAWVEYLGANPDLAPDFARRGVVVDAPDVPVAAGAEVTVGVADLDLTSLGSPLNTDVTGTLVARGGDIASGTVLGTADVADGAADLTVTVPAQTEAGDYDLWVVAEPSGTTVRVPVTVEVDDPGAPAWESTVVYTGGDVVTYDGATWQAQWWTQGQAPGATPWGPWMQLGDQTQCGQEWTASAVYTSGDTVVHEGRTYEAQWWTRAQEPAATPWGPWKDTGACA